MEDIASNITKSIKTRRVLPLLIVGFILLGTIFYFIKFPVLMAGWFVPFEVVTPSYIPIKVKNDYVKVIGFDRVKIVYENQDESISTWVTSEIGWNNVSSWDEKITLKDGTTSYYNEMDGTQMLSWIMDKVEYSIEYRGNKPLPIDELIKMAASISITRFAMSVDETDYIPIHLNNHHQGKSKSTTFG